MFFSKAASKGLPRPFNAAGWICSKGMAAPRGVGRRPDASKAYPEAPNRVGRLASPLCQGYEGGHTGWVYVGDP